MDIVDRIKEQCPEILDVKPAKPGLVCFRNSLKAAEMLYKHTVLDRNSKKAVHCDVDVDGIASGVVMHREFTGLGCLASVGFTINKNREHGVKALHSDWASQSGVQLLIVVDSSCNNLDAVKAMPCDVIILDHHVIDHAELSGKTAGGEYVIVSNMVDGDQAECEDARSRLGLGEVPMEGTENSGLYLPNFHTDPHMSGCEVCYEFCRLFEVLYKLGSIVEDSRVFQWVGLSLWTDSISTANKRNQWYIERTVEEPETEVALAQIMKSLNKYQRGLDKSFVQFTMAPTINCTIRAGKSLEALNTVLNYPGNIDNLRKYREKQLTALTEAERTTEEHDSFVLLDITGSEKADSGFCGVISTKLVDRTGKNACTYVVMANGMYKGSFRGRVSGVDYLRRFNEVLPGAFAQGHDAAFGFELTHDDLLKVMESLPEIEQEASIKLEITAGSMPDSMKGEQHIADMAEFIRAGKLVALGIANSRLSNKEEHTIIVPLRDIEELPKQSRGRMRVYDVLGIQCKSFEELRTEYVQVYPEYTGELAVYVRNIQLSQQFKGD